MNTSASSPDAEAARRTAWISRGLEELISDLEARRRRPAADFDVVIVGSGYGGAVAAAKIAGCTSEGRPVSVCVLERGNEYLRGMFPSRMADLAGHVRFCTEGNPYPRGEREGLFDVRVGADVSAVVANGLGGGSLINAGVMEEPDAGVFAKEEWPKAIRDDPKRTDCYAHARELLGAVVPGKPPIPNTIALQPGGVPAKEDPIRNTIELHPKGVPAKYEALRQLARGPQGTSQPFRAAAITVAMTDKDSSAGVALKECLRCGDCATGCNHGAKDSLDVNLLVTAWRARAKIYTGATVLKIELTSKVVPGTRDVREPAWSLDVVHTEGRLRERQGAPFRLTARKVILAAGTFGSTEILLRSRSETLQFSPQLGQRFSTNGDMIAVAYDQQIGAGGQRGEVNAAADETQSPGARKIGPTITGLIDLRGSSKAQIVIEELAVPGPLARLFEEVITTSHVLHGLATTDRDGHDADGSTHDPCAIKRSAVRSSSIFALMGDDGTGGALELVGDDNERTGDGAIRIRWPEARDRPVFAAQIDALRALGAESGTRGEVLPNPLWQLLPDRMQFLLDGKRGPLLTVHPLGGCSMGETVWQGVVDDLGQVFDGRAVGKVVLPGLVVLDGSIVPVSLGINPSLTIAALALRAITSLRDDKWEYTRPTPMPPQRATRPVFRAMPEPVPPRRTEIEIVERMSGNVALRAKDHGAISCVVELTLRFKRSPFADLMLPAEDGQVRIKRTLAVEKGDLRIFSKEKWDAWRARAGREDELDDIVEFAAPVTGELDFLHREASTRKERQCRGLRAWFVNRGLRDVVQEVVQRLGDDAPLPKDLPDYLRGRWHDLKALASHAGEVRQFEYRLAVGVPGKAHTGTVLDTGAFESAHAIGGRKRLTYSRRSNPWRQLQRMTLDAFPGMVEGPTTPVLELDTTYLAREHVPLLRIVAHQDEPSALADLVSFVAYFVRLLLTIHVWTFRRPDAAPPREPQRLPGIVDGLPAPVIRELDLETMQDGRPVRVRLTRYKRPPSGKPPVVLIHGYSASGTTFAHHAVNPNLAQYLWERKRDVWILDLRTSSGMPTARYPWSFEDAALTDLPAAFDYIVHETSSKLDVFAHCMGSAMFSMALLAPPESGDRYFREREVLPKMIHKVVLSQIGPVVVFSPANIFRAYIMNYLRYFLPLANYEFRVSPDPSLTDQMIDRFLAALPYPEEEFDIENPFWPPWRRTPFVGTRHRMDALYGRDFSLVNLDDRVLDWIDDLFGPLSIDTVSQAINFARLEVITNRFGRNEWVTRHNFLTRWKDIPTLSIHGVDNGLADVATLARMEQLLSRNLEFKDYETRAFPGFGHQDCLIGKNAREVFDVVYEFMERPTDHG